MSNTIGVMLPCRNAKFGVTAVPPSPQVLRPKIARLPSSDQGHGRGCVGRLYLRVTVIPFQELPMKQAQELRAGNVVMVGKDPMVILKAEYNKGGRNSAVMKMKMKNLLTGAGLETVFKADDKLDQVILDRKDVTYSYFADPLYVFMDGEFNQYEVESENLGDALNYIEDGMPGELVFYNGKPISIELPASVVREIIYTEPGVKGDTSGKVLKPAKISTGYMVSVPLFCNTGDRIEIDTGTGEYRRRIT
jgi:elongation factor P